MARLLKLGLFASLAAYVSAKCDNQCSGHGTCMTDDVCACYDNFGSGLSHDSGDCSDRICPFEVAWVDHPDNLGHHHKYLECAGKGICDRSTGECQCFEGYEGKGCQRASCPNDCSGHGRCEYIEDLPYGATWNDWVDSDSATSSMQTRTQSLFSDDAKTFDYHLWDKSKSRKCVCDATYGDLDCSKRLCPYGTDVLDTKDDTHYGLLFQKYQEQTILLSSLSGDFAQLNGKSFALTFVSRLNETFTTVPISLSADTEYVDLQNDIKLALLKLPNGVIDGVKVSVDYVDDTDLYKLVSDNLFPAVSFSVDITRAESAKFGAPQLTLLTADQDTILAVGCKLSGAMVPRNDTAIAAVTSIPASDTNVLTVSTYTMDLTSANAAALFEVSAVVFCVKGSTVLTTATDDGLAADAWISVPACGIGAAKVSTAHGESPAAADETIVDTPATVTVTSADSGTGVSAYALLYTCVLNGQIVARMALKGTVGGTTMKEFVVGYGAILPGCKIMNAAGTGTVTGLDVTVTSDASLIKIYDAYVNQEIYASSPTGADSEQTFQCAQAYLPLDTPTHTFTDGNGFPRGQSYDESGNYIGGQDQAILPGIGVDNHRRRLANTGLVTIKIGFSGPSVQGPQHLLIVEDYQCDAGCTPKLTGMPLETRLTSNYWSTVVELTKSDFNSYECGRRGKCDYSTGLCQCFAGYVGDNCNTLTTLV